MGINIIRLKGLHSNQKGFWDILKKPDFIIGDSYYDFQAFISQLHLIGSPPNLSGRSIISQWFNVPSWSKSEISTISEIKAREGANFQFSWFQPSPFSQIWWGSRIWTIKRKLRSVIGESPKKKFMKFWQRAAEIWDLKEGQNWDFSKSYISAALCQNFMKFFLVTLLWHISNVLFMVHIREPLQIWEKRHGWNLENPKLAPSLAFILEMVGISDLDHNKSNIDWLNIVHHTQFGGLPIKWSRDIKAWKL